MEVSDRPECDGKVIGGERALRRRDAGRLYVVDIAVKLVRYEYGRPWFAVIFPD